VKNVSKRENGMVFAQVLEPKVSFFFGGGKTDAFIGQSS